MCFVETMWTCDGGQMQELAAGDVRPGVRWDELTSEGWTPFTLWDQCWLRTQGLIFLSL